MTSLRKETNFLHACSTVAQNEIVKMIKGYKDKFGKPKHVPSQ